jgi:thiamine biosynthesis lipoprotein
MGIVSPTESAEPTQTRFEFRQTEMAIPIRIILYAPDNATAGKAAKAAFARFHELNTILSDYDPASELRRLCDTSSEGHAIPVSNDLWRVLVRAEQIARLSGGAFDITISPVVHLWRSARQTKELPSSAAIARARRRVGREFVRLDAARQAVELLQPKMRLDLGGIAKGYAVDEALAVLRQEGISRMLVDAGGNLGLGDPPPERLGWRIGIAPPDVNRPPRAYLSLARSAVSTSGDLWQYTIIDGKRYSHLIDPHTGMALMDHSSVTVVGSDGMTADGLSSAIAVLGPAKGLELIETQSGLAAFIVQTVDGKERTYESRRWKHLRHDDAYQPSPKPLRSGETEALPGCQDTAHDTVGHRVKIVQSEDVP